MKYFYYLSNSSFFNSKNNNIRNRVEKQIWSKENPIPCKDVQDNLESFFRNLTESQKLVFDYLNFLSNHNQVVYVSQSGIAKHAGIGRQYCNRIIRGFEELGLISTNYRHMKTSLYKISNFFANPLIRSRLCHIIKSFRKLPLILLWTQSLLGLLGYNNNYKYHTQTKSYRSREFVKNLSRSKNCRGCMNNEYPISPVIRDIKILNLTRWGQIKLSAFPDDAIKEAISRMEYFKSAKDPFALFMKICLEYCKTENISPNWDWYYKLSKVYNMPENAPMILTSPKSTPLTSNSLHVCNDDHLDKLSIKQKSTYKNNSTFNKKISTLKNTNGDEINPTNKLGYYKPWGGFKETNPDFDMDGFRFEWSARKMIDHWNQSSGFLKQCMKELLIKHINECRLEHVEQLMKELQ